MVKIKKRPSEVDKALAHAQIAVEAQPERTISDEHAAEQESRLLASAEFHRDMSEQRELMERYFGSEIRPVEHPYREGMWITGPEAVELEARLEETLARANGLVKRAIDERLRTRQAWVAEVCDATLTILHRSIHAIVPRHQDVESDGAVCRFCSTPITKEDSWAYGMCRLHFDVSTGVISQQQAARLILSNGEGRGDLIDFPFPFRLVKPNRRHHG